MADDRIYLPLEDLHHFGVTEAMLAALPPGHYQLTVWHPRVKTAVTMDVTVPATGEATQVVTVTLRPDRRIRRAPDASGASGYR